MKRGGLALLVLVHLTCHQAILTAPPGSSITLFANPEFIEAHGGVSVISALVIEPAGTPVPDGTVVQFFTTLGRIDEQGKTNDGVARVNLVADGRSGTATVRAFSGGTASTGGGGTTASPSPAASPGTTPTSPQGGSVTVLIGSARPDHVVVTADPPRIVPPVRHTEVTANVFDGNGNAVANMPVIFTVDGATEFMESVGRPIFTDTSGRAKDIMLTQYPRDGAQKTVTVKATTSNSKEGSTRVVIN